MGPVGNQLSGKQKHIFLKDGTKDRSGGVRTAQFFLFSYA